MSYQAGFRRQQPKQEPSEKDIQQGRVFDIIEGRLLAGGPVTISPRQIADGAGVSVATVNRLLDESETAGVFFVEHLDDGNKVVRQPRRMAFAHSDRASGRKGPQDRQKRGQPSHMQSETGFKGRVSL